MTTENGGRPKRYEDNAARQKAYRDRKRGSKPRVYRQQNSPAGIRYVTSWVDGHFVTLSQEHLKDM